MGSPTIKASNNISIIWGTTNAALGNSNVMNGALIDTLSVTPKNGEPIDIEGNQGFSAVLVGLDDGFSGRAACVFDSNVIYPAYGATVYVVGPRVDGTKGTANYNCNAWGFGFSRNKKGQKTIEITVTHRPDINGAPTNI
jgi:hypothetical protein